MKRALCALTGAFLLLAGCAGWTLDGRIDEVEAEKIKAAIATIEGQRIAWNAAGYDPLRVSPPVLSTASLACGSLAMAGALADPGIGLTVQRVCTAALNIAGPAAAPLVAPAEAPET